MIRLAARPLYFANLNCAFPEEITPLHSRGRSEAPFGCEGNLKKNGSGKKGTSLLEEGGVKDCAKTLLP